MEGITAAMGAQQPLLLILLLEYRFFDVANFIILPLTKSKNSLLLLLDQSGAFI
jgi:hypothetical protein